MTDSMAQRKSKMPEANKMARSLRAGRTTGDLAVRYGINSNVIIQQLAAHGWDPNTGIWVGDIKKNKTSDAPLAVRGGGPGQSRHHVGGGDNPNVVSTTARPFRERRRFTGLTWPVATTEDAPVPAVVAMPPKKHSGGIQKKISTEQESELARRYLDGESPAVLARDYSVNERTIRKWLTALGTPMRSRSEAMRLRREQLRTDWFGRTDSTKDVA